MHMVRVTGLPPGDLVISRQGRQLLRLTVPDSGEVDMLDVEAAALSRVLPRVSIIDPAPTTDDEEE